MKKTEIKTKRITRSFDPTLGITRNPKDPRLGAKRIVNMYVDKSKPHRALTNVPGLFGSDPLGGRVSSIACHKERLGDVVYIHAGDKIYSVPKEKSDSKEFVKELFTGFNSQSIAIDQDGHLLIFDGRRFLSVDSDGTPTVTELEGEYSTAALAVFNNRVFFYDEGSGSVYYTDDISEGLALRITGEVAKIKGIKKMLPTPDRLYLITEGDVRSLKWDGEGFSEAESLCGISAEDGMIIDGRLLLLSDRLVSIPLPLRSGEMRLISDNVSDILSGGGWRFGGEWRGYIVIYRGGEILLCDRDTIGSEPIWFMMSGVGCHARDRWLYRYTEEVKEGFDRPPESNGVCRGEVISCFDENGKETLYEEKDGKRYQVYNSGMKMFGKLLPPITLSATPGLLIFGTEGGSYCLCRSDITSGEDYFAFDLHIPEITLELHADDGGLPATKKNSTPKSFNIGLKKTPDSFFEVKVKADGKEVARQKFDTPVPKAKSDFEYIIQSIRILGENSFNIAEHARGFYKKQVEINAEAIGHPISISEISYTLEYEKE